MKIVRNLFISFFLFSLFLGCGGATTPSGSSSTVCTISLTEDSPNTILLRVTGGATWKPNVATFDAEVWMLSILKWTKISGDINSGNFMTYAVTRVNDTDVKINFTKFVSAGSGTMAIDNKIISNPTNRLTLFNSPAGATWAIGTNVPVTITITL